MAAYFLQQLGAPHGFNEKYESGLSEPVRPPLFRFRLLTTTASFLAVQPWPNHLNSLAFSFFISKMGINVVVAGKCAG